MDGMLNQQVGDGLFGKVLAQQTQGSEFNTQNLHKKLSMVAYTCNPNSGERGDRGIPGVIGQLQVNKRPCFKQKIKTGWMAPEE